jgi:hypothetical protein
VIGFLLRRGVTKGLLGGSRPWLILWLVLFGVRMLRKITGSAPEVVYSEKLEEGETLVISSKDRSPKIIGA